MTYYLQSGNTFRQTATVPNFIEKLPTATYVLKRDDHGWFYEQISDFELPPKVYGDLTPNRDRIISTFLDRKSATGVMLAGEKGSGKTLLGKALAIELAKAHDIPTIVINHPWSGDPFNSLVQAMAQPALWLFDEFEKVYCDGDQEAVLTLLDGVYPTKKLFVITTNDKWRIDQHMRNRPGRIFYMLDFAGLDVEFIREYAEDNLKDKSKVDSVCLVSNLFSKFNFDMLKAIVEEMNRYDETAQQAMKMLNARPEFEAKAEFEVRLWEQGGRQEVTGAWLDTKVWSGNPVTNNVQVRFYTRKLEALQSYEVEETLVRSGMLAPTAIGAYMGEDEACDSDSSYPVDGAASSTEMRSTEQVRQAYQEGKVTHTAAVFGPADIKKVDGDGVFYYKNERGQTMQLRKKFRPAVDYWDAL